MANFWGKKITKLSLACKNISQLIYSTLVSYTKSIKMIKSNNLEYLVAKRYRFDWLRYVRESLKMRLGSQCSDNSQNIVLGAFFFSVYTYLLYQILNQLSYSVVPAPFQVHTRIIHHKTDICQTFVLCLYYKNLEHNLYN